MPESFYSLEFINKASFDFDEAYSWYEKKQDGLGEEFTKKSESNSIRYATTQHKKTRKNQHEALVDRFLFSLSIALTRK